ncbi:MAG: hypothetical protein ABI361_02935 [Nitrososphaera sp.]
MSTAMLENSKTPNSGVYHCTCSGCSHDSRTSCIESQCSCCGLEHALAILHPENSHDLAARESEFAAEA